MELLPVLFPLFSSLVVLLFGRFIGVSGSLILTISLIGFSLLISLYLFFVFGLSQTLLSIEVLRWFTVGELSVSWSFYYDSLTAVMFLVVLSISFCVHVYSVGYMGSDPHLARFFAYLSLFTFFMLLLVCSSNFVQLFVGWEGVGVCSYLLISFWFSRRQANKSALKAMVVNRVGDFGFLLGIFLCFFLFKTVDFPTLFVLVSTVPSSFSLFGFDGFTAISLLLLVGAVGKSAQLGLHTWLPDAMEGPTPVSALIHAATMVTAGVFLLLRCSPLLDRSPTALSIISVVGAGTALFGATVGLFQNDLKRVVAYSTCSQLGYMVFATGFSAYGVALFHLYNHAFFKALLFLSAGAVIHAYSDEQDMRRMGGLVRLLPFTYSIIVIGSLALAGFPFLTGFYSKDFILESASVPYSFVSSFSCWLGVVAALFTAFYSVRLIYLTFLSAPRGYNSVYAAVGSHEPLTFMLFPLIFLSLASIFVGYLSRDLFVGFGSDFLAFSLGGLPSALLPVEAEFLSVWRKQLPFIFSLVGGFLSLIAHYLFHSWLVRFYFLFPTNFLFLLGSRRWFFDYLQNSLIVWPGLRFGYSVSFRLLDRGVIELLGPTGLARFFATLSSAYVQVHSGYLYHYLFIMVAGLAIGLLFFLGFFSLVFLKLSFFILLGFTLLIYFE